MRGVTPERVSERGVTPERVSEGGMSDAESEKGVTPGRVIEDGERPSDWVSVREFRLVGRREHRPLLGGDGLSKKRTRGTCRGRQVACRRVGGG